ncbi:hypothetical protein FH972_021172 [Carpinus fangiana]|uniref:3-oxoacyl-[acyl-carrier-protein] reductase n=1 Tax=Carpinus fangiana TaxID=176857 RepID=A0A5N6KNR7_9ROSI|nr:hypothetical protein FH972_021172 [Carpinus fangiana]
MAGIQSLSYTKRNVNGLRTEHFTQIIRVAWYLCNVKEERMLTVKANTGIGFELAATLLADSSKHVLLGSRSIEKGGAAVKDLQSRKLAGTVELLQVDVSDEGSIKAAAKSVESKHGRLDALVNNAGTAGIGGPKEKLAQQMMETFKVNTVGPELMVEAFAPLMKKSGVTPRIINISSGMGSIARSLDPSNPSAKLKAIDYRASKAALNMVTTYQALEYGPQGFKVFSYCPGFTVSSLGPYNTLENGAQPTSDAVVPLVKVINGERDAEHAAFLKANGQYPWNRAQTRTVDVHDIVKMEAKAASQEAKTKDQREKALAKLVQERGFTLYSQLEGEIALITGSSRGLGLAIARLLRAEGAFVVLNFKDHARAGNANIVATELDGLALRADVSQLDQVESMFQEVERQKQRPISVVVNNALASFGFNGDARSKLEDISWDDFDAQLNVALRGALNTTKAALPGFEKLGHGCIINIGSNLVQNPVVPYHDYTASKGALLAFTRTAAAELGPRNITVNMVSGGLLKVTDASRVTPDEVFEQVRTATPLRKVTTPEDLAGAVAFFASPWAKGVTGQQLCVDGGLVMC